MEWTKPVLKKFRDFHIDPAEIVAITKRGNQGVVIHLRGGGEVKIQIRSRDEINEVYEEFIGFASEYVSG
jgi:hypothetical protein